MLQGNDAEEKTINWHKMQGVPFNHTEWTPAGWCWNSYICFTPAYIRQNSSINSLSLSRLHTCLQIVKPSEGHVKKLTLTLWNWPQRTTGSGVFFVCECVILNMVHCRQEIWSVSSAATCVSTLWCAGIIFQDHWSVPQSVSHIWWLIEL